MLILHMKLRNQQCLSSLVVPCIELSITMYNHQTDNIQFQNSCEVPVYTLVRRLVFNYNLKLFFVIIVFIVLSCQQPVTCSAKSRYRESTPRRPRLHRRPSVSNATAPVIDNVRRLWNRNLVRRLPFGRDTIEICGSLHIYNCISFELSTLFGQPEDV